MTLRALLIGLLVLVPGSLAGQRVIPLYPGAAPGSESWTQQERQYYSTAWKTEIVANVVRPTLLAYLPAKARATGTAVVICPGGGFYALSINSEGIEVAKWLAARGVAAFVLKYRLVRTGADASAELAEKLKSGVGPEFKAATADVIPLALADGNAAVAWVRAHAAEFGVAPERVGLMGFSAGAMVTAEVAVHYTPESRPAFVAPIYGGALAPAPVPADAPPMFLAAASDDQLGLAPGSVDLYSRWLAAKKPVEMHLYAQGGHGFGMRTQHLPTDTWIERFHDWLGLQGFLSTRKKLP